MEASTAENGKHAPTGDKFLEDHPNKVKELARKMAEEMVAIHRITSDLPFGGFEDIPDSNADNVTEYFAGKIDDAADLLGSIGVTPDEIVTLKEKFKTIEFPEKGVMVHGDFLPVNVLVQSDNPLTIKIIDPMPSINDPYWDIARNLNQYEFMEAWIKEEHHDDEEGFSEAIKTERDFNDAFIEKYEADTCQLDRKRLHANQIIFALGHIQRSQARLTQTGEVANGATSRQERVVAILKRQLKQRIVNLLDEAA